jgi:hypothetical protein
VKTIERATQRRDRADDHGASRHLVSIICAVGKAASDLVAGTRSYQGRRFVAKQPVDVRTRPIRPGMRWKLRRTSGATASLLAINHESTQ